MTTPSPQKHGPRLPPEAWAILVLGVGLRFSGLTTHSLWFDETATVYLSKHYAFVDALSEDRNPPLVFLLFRLWIGVFGERDEVLRALPALISSCTVAILVLLLPSLTSRRIAWTASLLLACSPFSIWYGQEVRGYGMAELGCTLHSLGILWLLDAKRRGAAGLALVSMGAFVATGAHYTCYLIGLQAAAVATYSLVRRRGRPLLTVVGSALGGALWAPWLVTVLPRQLATAWGYPEPPTLRAIVELPARLILIEPDALGASFRWVPWTMVILVFTALLLAARALGTSGPQVPFLLFLAPPAGSLLISFAGVPIFGPRYLIASEPGLLLLVAHGFHALSRTACHILLAMLVTGLAGLALGHKVANLREDYREACRQLASNWREGDHVATITGMSDGFSQASLRHYCLDNPKLLASIVPEDDLRKGRIPPGRLHIVFREAPYSWPLFEQVVSRGATLIGSPMRFRVQYLLLQMK